jgi:hypothetical protein
MPCACQVPVPDYPATADWGPILWNILHGFAERTGRSINKADEVREWQKFIKATSEVLPCDICREHFKRYQVINPFTHITQVPSTDVRTWVKTWLLNIHNEINAGTNKPIFSYADLEAKYIGIDLADQLYRLTPIIKNAISLSGVPYMKWTAWVASFKMMRSILCL